MTTPGNAPLPAQQQRAEQHPSDGIANRRSCGNTLKGEPPDGDKELSGKRQKTGSASPFAATVGNPSHATDESNTQPPETRKQQHQQQQHQHQPQTTTTTTTILQKRRKKRKICERCHRPVPQTCLCESLPAVPIALATTEVVVLQHPLELKNHKAASHRSLPLLELCLDSSSLALRTGRRFGTESLGVEILSKLWGNGNGVGDDETSSAKTSYLPVLVFPKVGIETNLAESVTANQTEVRNNTTTNNSSSSGNTESRDTKHHQSQPPRYREDESAVLSLSELVERWRCPTKTTTTTNVEPPEVSETNETIGNKKILLLVLDATWKHAREMHLANIKADQYPPHMLRLALQPEDFAGGFVPGRFRLRGKASKTGYKQQQQQQQQQRQQQSSSHSDRNKEEAPQIDETWMSTAECIAWILSNLEGSNHETKRPKIGETPIDSPSLSLSLYEILMKPLDAMVAKWNFFRSSSKNSNRTKGKAAPKFLRCETKGGSPKNLVGGGNRETF